MSDSRILPSLLRPTRMKIVEMHNDYFSFQEAHIRTLGPPKASEESSCWSDIAKTGWLADSKGCMNGGRLDVVVQ